jgi:hypothetical protein
MGNQQGRDNMIVTDVEWAWLAGMMNGDGCFFMTLRRVDNRWKCDMKITLTQCDPCIIEKATSILNRGINCNPSIVEYSPTGAGVSTKYNMVIGKMEYMAKFIDHIDDYMCGVKQAKAQLLKRYILNRMQYDGKSRRKNTIESDPLALKMAIEFYELSGTTPPKEVVKALRDYPVKGVGTSVPKCATL